MSIPIPVLLIISMSACLGGGIISKYYASKNANGFLPVFLYNFITGSVSALVLFCWGGFGSASTFTLLLGALFGLVVCLQGVATLLALRIGPMSFTSVIVSFSTVLTALSGTLFWDEVLKPLQVVGILLMAVSFVFAVEKKSDEKSGSWKWLLLCLLAFVCSGGVGLMQKIHQTSVHKGELNAFLIAASAVSSIFSICAATLAQAKEKTPLLPKNEKGNVAWVLLGIVALAGAFTSVNHKLNLYLSGVMSSAVFFPIVNGGGLVLATLAALIVFREKLTKKQWCGVIVGTISVLCLCL